MNRIDRRSGGTAFSNLAVALPLSAPTISPLRESGPVPPTGGGFR